MKQTASVRSKPDGLAIWKVDIVNSKEEIPRRRPEQRRSSG
jgi:hypothetical protein